MTNPILFWVVVSLALSLFSFVIAFTIPNRYAWLVSLIATIISFMAALSSGYVFTAVWNTAPVDAYWNWFTLGNQNVAGHILLNNLTVLMMLLVSVISFLVHLYSIGYMAADKSQQRYYAFLGFFSFSMLGVVIAGNLLQLFIFWELMGFSSYMLIGHWREKPEAAKAAQKAFLFNRIGDAGFLIGLMILWTNAETLDISLLTWSNPAPYTGLAGLCIFLGVIGKSAQLPLLTWLSDAMEGPTPVSALIHAATMVAAGVFLLARLFPIFTPDVLLLISVIGAATGLVGSILALIQYDLKKILAYSTVSQLGLMVMGIGAGAYEASMLHLFTHAFFKAGLFLAAGSVIHALHQDNPSGGDVQDIRLMGGLRKQLPFTFLVFVLAGASLSGLPFSSGFLSKDAILSSLQSTPFLIAGLSLSLLTAAYTFRLVWYVFFGKSSESIQLHEPPLIMQIPMALLAAGSLWFVVSFNPFEFQDWLLAGLQPGKRFYFNFITLASTAVILIALAVFYFVFRSKSLKANSTPSLLFWQNNLGLDWFYQKTVVAVSLWLSSLVQWIDIKVADRILHVFVHLQVTLAYFIGWVDRSIVDGTVQGAAKLTGGVGSLTRSFAAGKIQSYILWSVLALITFVVWFMLF